MWFGKKDRNKQSIVPKIQLRSEPIHCLPFAEINLSGIPATFTKELIKNIQLASPVRMAKVNIVSCCYFSPRKKLSSVFFVL